MNVERGTLFPRHQLLPFVSGITIRIMHSATSFPPAFKRLMFQAGPHVCYKIGIWKTHLRLYNHLPTAPFIDYLIQGLCEGRNWDHDDLNITLNSSYTPLSLPSHVYQRNSAGHCLSVSTFDAITGEGKRSPQDTLIHHVVHLRTRW